MKILHDLFPAFITVVPPTPDLDFTSVLVSPSASNIHTGARYLERVRVIVFNDGTSDVIQVAADHHAGPRIIFSERLQPEGLNWSGNRTDDSQAITLSGKIIAFKYVKGCNCGSRLRNFNPYGANAIIHSSKDPQ